MEYLAKDYGIIPDCDVTAQLNALLNNMQDVTEAKTLIFSRGKYFFNGALCPVRRFFITNTMADKEWQNGERKNFYRVALNIDNIDDLTVEGNGAEFVIDGQVTNIVVTNSSRITLKNISVEVIRPDAHNFVVKKSKHFYTEFLLTDDSQYRVKGRGYEFFGRDYVSNFVKNVSNAYWNAISYPNGEDSVKRVRHPFFGAVKIVEKSKNLFGVTYSLLRKFKEGERYCIFDGRRRNVGIFIENSQNVNLIDIKQHFNYGLACVAQCSSDLELSKCDFSPKGEGRMLASIADFVQLCCCRGKVKISGNNFYGAGDDCLNVHGFNFIITLIKGNIVTVKFCHPQSYGFNPFREGDAVEIVFVQSLNATAKTTVNSSRMITPYLIELEVDNAEYARVGDCVENVSACPDVEFDSNKLTAIITRGLLITTRGEVKVTNNDFVSCEMSHILVSDDARTWFESGCVKNLTIKGNSFGKSHAQYDILIKPENRKRNRAVHSGIVIVDNRFIYGGKAYIKSSDDVIIQKDVALVTDNVTRLKRY